MNYILMQSRLVFCWSSPQSTYIFSTEHAVSDVFRTFDPPPPPSTQWVCSSPAPKAGAAGGYTLGGGGSIFRNTSDIGLASYSIIPLRSSLTLPSCVNSSQLSRVLWSTYVNNNSYLQFVCLFTYRNHLLFPPPARHLFPLSCSQQDTIPPPPPHFPLLVNELSSSTYNR
jgi:hypothetical protein